VDGIQFIDLLLKPDDSYKSENLKKYLQDRQQKYDKE
jgi:hypothetical protein